jgi:peptide subunit release factor 1 (eRF1)
MITEANLQELLSFKSQNPVLSLYLNTDPSQGSADVYQLSLRNMLKDINLAEDVAAVEHYFSREFDWTGRSVAVFSCAQVGFFRAYPLALVVPSRVRVSDRPHVKPLADLYDSFGGYGVVLIDKQGARVFSFHLGELREQEGVLGEEVRHTKRGGASSVPGRRGGVAGRTNNEQEVVERNMREAASFASHFFSENNIRRVVIGGSDDNVAQFRSLLPKSWQSLVVGSFHMNMAANTDEILARAMELGNQAESKQEEKLLNQIVTSAAKGKGGVLGLDGTLSAVREGRIQILAFQNGYRAPGYRCQGCGYLTAQVQAVCPYCGGSFSQIPDAVEMAVHDVMRAGGDVDVLQQEHQVKGFENIGALLRY